MTEFQCAVCAMECPRCGARLTKVEPPRSEHVPDPLSTFACSQCRATYSHGVPPHARDREARIAALSGPHEYVWAEMVDESLEQDGQRWTRQAGGDWVHEATWNGTEWVEPTDPLPYPLGTG